MDGWMDRWPSLLGAAMLPALVQHALQPDEALPVTPEVQGGFQISGNTTFSPFLQYVLSQLCEIPLFRA